MPNNSERQRAQGRDWLFAAVVVVVFTVTGSVILRSIDPQWFAAIVAIGALLAEGLIAAAILRRSQRVGPELARYASLSRCLCKNVTPDLCVLAVAV